MLIAALWLYRWLLSVSFSGLFPHSDDSHSTRRSCHNCCSATPRCWRSIIASPPWCLGHSTSCGREMKRGLTECPCWYANGHSGQTSSELILGQEGTVELEPAWSSRIGSYKTRTRHLVAYVPWPRGRDSSFPAIRKECIPLLHIQIGMVPCSSGVGVIWHE